MPAQTATLKRVNQFNQNNLKTFAATLPAVADNDTIELTIPEMAGDTYLPAFAEIYTYGAGDPGARTATKVDSFTDAQACVITSWDEATGKLVMTNTINGGIALGSVLVVGFIPVS